MKKKFMFASILELLLIIVYHNIHSIRRFRMIWRLPNGSNKIARLDAKSTVVLLLDIVVSFADSARIRCRFHVGSLSFILSVLMLLFGHHRRHKLACCTCFAFCCLFHWFLFIFAQRKSCVLKGFRRLSIMFFFFLLSFWKKCDVGFFFGLMKLCDVIAGAFGVSGCILLRTVLRDVAIVVQFWCVSEHIR